MAWEPTTITPGLPMIWHAVGVACSSWWRRISAPLENGLALALGEWPDQRRFVAGSAHVVLTG